MNSFKHDHQAQDFLYTTRLTPKQQAFVDSVLAGHSYIDAYAVVSVEPTSDQPSRCWTLPTHCRTLEVINPAATVLVEPTLIANTKLDAKPCGNAPEHDICNGSCDQSALSKCAHEFGGYQTPKWYQLLSMHT